jgi:peptidyl-prolyl cis-trans isomerase A (cyclophilin A)
MYLNLGDNSRLDRLGFAPIGRIVEGVEVLDSLFSEYGEQPDQAMIQSLGNSYLERMYPKLDYVKTARVVP